MIISIKKEVRLLILALACVCLMAVAHATGITGLVYIVLLCYLALCVFANEVEVLYLFLFFLPWSTIIKPSPSAVSFCSVSSALVFLSFCFWRGHSKVKQNQLFAVAGIAAVTVGSSVLHNYGIATSHIMFILMLLFYPMLLSYIGDRAEFEVAAFFFSIGIISATIIASVYSDNQNLYNFVRILLDDGSSIVRNCGFYSDPNFYAAQTIAAIGCQLILIMHKKTGINKNIILVAALITCGATSVSKSFLICLLTIVLVWLYCLMKKSPTRLAKTVFYGAAIIGTVLASGLFSELFDQFIARFGKADDFSALTTGRSVLWKEYVQFLISNPIELVLGQGFTSVFNGVRRGSHNTIIQIVYQFGLVGSIMLIVWFISIMKSVQAKKTKFSQCLLLTISCFSMWLGLDMLFFDDFFLIICLYVLGMNYIHKQPCKVSNT